MISTKLLCWVFWGSLSCQSCRNILNSSIVELSKSIIIQNPYFKTKQPFWKVRTIDKRVFVFEISGINCFGLQGSVMKLYSIHVCSPPFRYSFQFQNHLPNLPRNLTLTFPWCKTPFWFSPAPHRAVGISVESLKLLGSRRATTDNGMVALIPTLAGAACLHKHRLLSDCPRSAASVVVLTELHTLVFFPGPPFLQSSRCKCQVCRTSGSVRCNES